MKRNRNTFLLLPASSCLLTACANPMPAPAPPAVTVELPPDDPALAELAPESPATRPPEVLETGDPDAPLIVIRRHRPVDRRPPDLVESVLRLAGFPGPGTYFARATGEDYEPNCFLGEGPLTPWGRYLLEANPYVGRDRPYREMKRAIQGLETRGLTPCDVGEDFMNPGRDPWDP